MRILVATALTATLLLTANAHAASVLFVLDASGSMWGQIDGEPKIEIARRVMGDLVDAFPRMSTSDSRRTATTARTIAATSRSLRRWAPSARPSPRPCRP